MLITFLLGHFFSLIFIDWVFSGLPWSNQTIKLPNYQNLKLLVPRQYPRQAIMILYKYQIMYYSVINYFIQDNYFIQLYKLFYRGPRNTCHSYAYTNILSKILCLRLFSDYFFCISKFVFDLFQKKRKHKNFSWILIITCQISQI